ncbi:MAG: hypothetical protein FD180_2393 [Planctomycetota bacterium]|nr:MAG: hypothetical protein FD180_2393 [Planctomycetota bacterium]
MNRLFPLNEVLPELSSQIERELRAEGRAELADQIRDFQIARWTHDPACQGIYVTTEGRPLNVVEQNVIGIRHGETVVLDSCNLDTDNFARISGIELFHRPDLLAKLEALSDRAC